MKWYSKILIPLSFIGGMILMFFMLIGRVGNKIAVTAKVKNKKSTVTDNEVYTQFDFDNTKEKPKFGLFKKLKNKRLKRKNRKK